MNDSLFFQKEFCKDDTPLTHFIKVKTKELVKQRESQRERQRVILLSLTNIKKRRVTDKCPPISFQMVRKLTSGTNAKNMRQMYAKEFVNEHLIPTIAQCMLNKRNFPKLLTKLSFESAFYGEEILNFIPEALNSLDTHSDPTGELRQDKRFFLNLLYFRLYNAGEEFTTDRLPKIDGDGLTEVAKILSCHRPTKLQRERGLRIIRNLKLYEEVKLRERTALQIDKALQVVARVGSTKGASVLAVQLMQLKDIFNALVGPFTTDIADIFRDKLNEIEQTIPEPPPAKGGKADDHESKEKQDARKD